MSKKQTRRSISLERRLHDATAARSEALTKSTSEYISDLIRADLIMAGIEPPPYKHAGIVINGVTPLPEQMSNVVYIKHTFAPRLGGSVIPLPTAVLVDSEEADGKAKYEQALAFVREKLAKGIDPGPRIGCQYCRKPFQPGEVPQKYKDQRVHGRCKREIMRMPDSLMP